MSIVSEGRLQELCNDRLNTNHITRALQRMVALARPDFSGAFVTLQQCQLLARHEPRDLNQSFVRNLQAVLADTRFASQKQAYFLYRSAAEALALIPMQRGWDEMGQAAANALEASLFSAAGPARRAAAEATSLYPLNIKGPSIEIRLRTPVPALSWQTLLKRCGQVPQAAPRWIGRSLVTPLAGSKRSLVVKMAGSIRRDDQINTEAIWMNHLQRLRLPGHRRFEVPQPLAVARGYLFRLRCPPLEPPSRLCPQHGRCAIAFLAPPGYYDYPNAPEAAALKSSKIFKRIICNTAWLLGRLTAKGIIHSAPIPLFHNRVQRHRRQDLGLYEWMRAGRLDRWLHSCAYPNFGPSGLRDFEHLEAFRGAGGRLYRHIGMHLLSLVLVIGSYFRQRDSSLVGFDHLGRPVDARHLFDNALLLNLIRGIFLNYYDGFCARPFNGALPFDLQGLAERMIDEMGVDRHMEEVLRVEDQVGMSEREFMAFLCEHGLTQENIHRLEKGCTELTIHTGPHLGGFNQSISLPELIDFLATVTALCLSGRYRMMRAA